MDVERRFESREELVDRATDNLDSELLIRIVIVEDYVQRRVLEERGSAGDKADSRP